MSLTSKYSISSRIVLGALAATLAAACGGDSTPPPPPPPVSTIGLSASSVAFTDTVGTASPAAATVNVTNSGAGSLAAIATGTITYDNSASGWLSVSLSGTSVPAVLTLTASIGTLAAGTYTASVPVTA